MVRSKIDNEISYPDSKEIDIVDNGTDAATFDFSIKGNNIIIALGKLEPPNIFISSSNHLELKYEPHILHLKLQRLEKEINDLWDGMDYLSNPYGG